MAHRDEERSGWSTRELAETVGTTVKTIRHYHQAGLLEEPVRRQNGYKAYGPEHAVRLLDILRLRELGFSVAQIGEAMRADGSSGPDPRELIDRIDASIRRLQVIRDGLVGAADSGERPRPEPQNAADTTGRAPDADTLMPQLMARHFTREALAALRSVDEARTPLDAEFDRLPADADDAVITDLSARMGPQIRRARMEHPMPERVVDGDRATQRRAAQAIGRMLDQLYNPAQLDVIGRALDTDPDSA